MEPANPELGCRDVIEFLGAYLEGELTREVAGAFESHLALCPACVEYLAGYRETIRLGRDAFGSDGSPPEAAPEELVRAILAARRVSGSGPDR